MTQILKLSERVARMRDVERKAARARLAASLDKVRHLADIDHRLQAMRSTLAVPAGRRTENFAACAEMVDRIRNATAALAPLHSDAENARARAEQGLVVAELRAEKTSAFVVEARALHRAASEQRLADSIAQPARRGERKIGAA